MAVTNQQIIDYLIANPNLSDAQIAATMQEFSVTPKQLAQAVGADPAQIQARYAEAAPNVYTAENVNKLASQILAQNTTEKWTGGLPPEKAALYMADELAKSGVSDIAQVGQGQNGIVNKMTGEKLVSGYGERTKGNLWSGSYEGKGNTGFGVEFDAQGKPVFFTQGASSSTLGKDILKLAAVAGAVYGLSGFEGLFGGVPAGAAGGAGAFEAANAGVGAFGGTDAITGGLLSSAAPSGLTAAQQLAFELQNAGASGLTDLSATTQAGLLTGGKTAAQLAAEQLAFETQNAGASALTNTANTALTTAGTKTAAELAAEKLAAEKLAADTALKTTTSLTAEDLAKKAAATVITNELTKKVNPDTVSGLFGTTGNLIQSQESKDAAKTAAQNITNATNTGVALSQFRPVGMTTRFGTSNYTYDPTTGQMTSAGYQLSPEAKAAQDRLVGLAGRGLTQAEQAQQQFAPLQQGATNLFNLGNQYIQQSPEQVAQDYINKQMALLAPSRETSLANLANSLSSKGTTGLSIAQGGGLKAANPVAQAFANAQAMQDLQLAANAQQAGQQNVNFGAGLLGQGANAMGQYYGGQTAAYQPYTTALGQIQNLETAGQQPLQLGAQLGQQSAQAGANAGRLAQLGAQASGNILTGNAATYNPYAGLLTAASNPNSMFGQSIANWYSGGTPSTTGVAGNPLAVGEYANPGYWT
jgi:hypothetical protein